jgi:transmembrane sensor
MEQQRLALLIEEWMNKTISDNNFSELIGFLEANRQEPMVAEIFQQMMEQESAVYEVAPERWDARIDQILNADKQINSVPFLNKPKRSVFKMGWVRYAAAIILLIGTGTYLWISNSHQKQPVHQAEPVTVSNDVPPGKEGAVLTLADGRQVVLDSAGNGIIATQNGSEVVLKNGHLSYKAMEAISEAVTYNTMTTPNGRQFQVVLPDGTKVWLNAASSITYPTAFTGDTRTVTVTGEVYFEVAPLRLRSGQKAPFIVNVNKQSRIEVLGTHFNVNAYANEGAILTTLLEGRVKVKSEVGSPKSDAGVQTSDLRLRTSVILQPGQQAKEAVNQKIQVIDKADLEKVMAWKNGYFDFNNSDLPVMVRQLERWYDIQVQYKGQAPHVIFKGQMDRNVQLSDVIRFLKMFKINANLEGRTLIITGN